MISSCVLCRLTHEAPTRYAYLPGADRVRFSQSAGDRLPATVVALLEDDDAEPHLSEVSLWEIAVKSRSGKLRPTTEFEVLVRTSRPSRRPDRLSALPTQSAWPAPNQWVHNCETGEAIEVAIGRPEFAHPMLLAESCDAGVMDPRSCNASACEQSS
jgi:hypothetical protein